MHDLFDSLRLGLQVKDHPVRFMQGANEITHIRAEDAFHRPLVWCDDMNFELTGPKRGSDFEPNEAGTDDDHLFRCLCGCDDCVAIGKRTQGMDVRLVCTGNCEANGFSPGRQQQPVIAHRLSARKQNLTRAKIKFDEVLTKAELNSILFIKALIPQWHIVKGDGASEIVL